MTGAEILAGFQAIGARVRLTPAGIVDVDAPAVPELERLVAEVKANRGQVVAELKRHAAPLVFDPDRLRRHEERAAWTAAVLAERYCGACRFSFWRVTSRGDAECYACALVRAGHALVCAACGRSDWHRDEHGHAVCATCAPGDTRVAAPPRSRPLAETSREVSEEGGAE